MPRSDSIRGPCRNDGFHVYITCFIRFVDELLAQLYTVPLKRKRLECPSSAPESFRLNQRIYLPVLKLRRPDQHTHHLYIFALSICGNHLLDL